MQSSISLRADISQLRSELAKVPGITEAEAQRMVIALEKNFKKAEAAAKSLTRSQTREAEKAAKAAEKAAADQARAYERSLDDIKRGSEKVFGGVVGDIEDVAKGLVSLGGTAGGFAAALGGSAVALAAVGTAAVAAASQLFEFIAGTEQAIDRLNELSGVEPIPPATLAAIDEWEQGALAAEAAGQRLYVVLAGELAQAFGDMPTFIAGATDSLTRAIGVAGEFADTLNRASEAGRTLAAVATLGGSEVTRWALGIDEAIASGEALASTVHEVGDEIAAVGPTMEDMAEGARKAAEEQAAATRAAMEAQREAAKEDAAFMAAQIAYMDEAFEARERQAEFDAAQVARVQELEQARIAADAAETARKEAQAAQDKADHAQKMAQIRAERDANIEALASVTQSMVSLFAYQTDAEWAALQERDDISKKELLEGWKRYKSAKRTEAIISAAAGALAIVPSMAYLGPAAFAAAAVAAGAGLAVQLATIGAQQPPEFPTGGYAMDRAGTSPRQSSVDHVVVGVRPDERILSPQESRMYDGGAQPVYLMLDRRVVAEAMVGAGGTARLAPPAGRVSGRATAYGRG